MSGDDEEEKDLVMLVTKSEVEQAKNEEISVLKERIEALKVENRSLTEKLHQIGSLYKMRIGHALQTGQMCRPTWTSSSLSVSGLSWRTDV